MKIVVLLILSIFVGVNSFLGSINRRYNTFSSNLKGNDDDFDEAFNRRVKKKLESQFSRSQPSNRDKGRASLDDMDGPDDEADGDGQKSGLLRLAGRWEVLNRALIAGIFVAGIGAGVTIDSAINTNPKDLASRDAIDRNAPNPKLCAAFGSSAMVREQLEPYLLSCLYPFFKRTYLIDMNSDVFRFGVS